MQQPLDLAIGTHDVRPLLVRAIFLKAYRGLAKLRPQRVGVRAIGVVVDLSQDGFLGHGCSPSYALVCAWSSCGVVTWDPLHPPFIRVVPGQDHRRIMGRDPRIGKGGWDRAVWRGLNSSGNLGGERCCLLNQALITLEPPGMIERHGSDPCVITTVSAAEGTPTDLM